MKKHKNPMESDPANHPEENKVSVETEESSMDTSNDTIHQDQKVTELEQLVVETKKKADEFKDKYLRSEADLDNLRKRTQKEKAEWRSFYHEEILEEILPVLDNFDRALLTKLEGDEARKFAEGIILVDKQLHEILTRHGLNEIECVGKQFNPHFHEAIMMVDTEEYPDNTVVEEIRKGYIRDEKVIRPSLVKVSKAK